MHEENNDETRMNQLRKNIPPFLTKNRSLLVVIAFLYMLPLTTTTENSPTRALLFIATQIFIYGLLAMAFDLQLGRAGLLNFGHVALFGVGAFFIAFTLDASILPYPLNIITLIPYPITLILAMFVGASIGFIMGLTTSRMKGTAFAFIALAIAMFLYNFFVENPALSGGETGLRISIPSLIRTAPFYLLFVAIAFIFLAALFGILIIYLKKRLELSGLILFIPVATVFSAFLFLFGANIVGPSIVAISFIGMIFLFFIERKSTIKNPLEYSEKQISQQGDEKTPSIVSTSLIPIIIFIIAMIGVILTFGTNITQMASLWFQNYNIYLYTIPVQYYLVLTCLVITYFFIRRLTTSPFGRMVSAVAQNEERAEALGFNSFQCKLVIVVISGAIAGLAGALYAPVIKTIDPTSALGVGVSIDAMLYTIIGGIGTLLGPILGAGLIGYSDQNLSILFEDVGLPSNLWLVGLGAIYILIVLFLPQGIVGSIKNRSFKIKQKLSQLKIGQFEFKIMDEDYWVFAILAVIGLFLLLLVISL